jgi:branched-chain amino acid transport system ATP-binding protein
VLLLDEPSSGLSEQETDDFAELLVGLATDGLGILLVEHDVDLVMHVCARIHVLDFGRVIAVGSPAEVQGDPLVQAAYLGTGVG